ncbi:hypothetical protein [Bacillus marasmi]|uniref:hypothetical protein n=1 Tax=Bacillus marasmi TaxID=1926279 RepID=UPI0011CCDF28|nr:hypothetical protein [Bacillus marasmi]
MHEPRQSSHRFSIFEENLACLNEDGIDVFLTGERFQHYLSIAESKLQTESMEIVGMKFNEKRMNPQSMNDMTFFDLP